MGAQYSNAVCCKRAPNESETEYKNNKYSNENCPTNTYWKREIGKYNDKSTESLLQQQVYFILY